MKIFGPVVGCLMVALSVSLPAAAQEYRGTIQGNITDAKGYVIDGAKVEARSAQQDYKITTNAKGYFVIPFVQPGTYAATVKAKGFRTEERPNLVLDVAQKIDLNLRLTAGGETEMVTVTTNPIQLATTDASGGTVIDPEKVQNLPLNGRQVYMLMALTPGGTVYPDAVWCRRLLRHARVGYVECLFDHRPAGNYQPVFC